MRRWCRLCCLLRASPLAYLTLDILSLGPYLSGCLETAATPLHWAAWYGCEPLVEALLERGAPIEAGVSTDTVDRPTGDSRIDALLEGK